MKADLRALAAVIDAATRSARPGGRGVMAALSPVVDLLLDNVYPNARPAWMDWIGGGERSNFATYSREPGVRVSSRLLPSRSMVMLTGSLIFRASMA